MKQNKIYRLTEALIKLFEAAHDKNRDLIADWIVDIVRNTGVEVDKFKGMLEETLKTNGTITQLKFRIIGDMQKRKVSVGHIE